MNKMSLKTVIVSTGLIALTSGCAPKQAPQEPSDEFIVAPGALADDHRRDDHGSMEEEMQRRMDEREHRMMEHMQGLMDERFEHMADMVRDGVEERMDHLRENAHRMGEEIHERMMERDDHIRGAFDQIFERMERFHGEIERLHESMHETEMRWQEHAEEFGHDIMGGMEDRDEGVKEAFEDVFSHIEELYHMLEEGRAWDDKEDWNDEEECEEDEGHEEDDHEMGFEFDIQIDTDDPEMAEFAQGISETIRVMVMEQMMQMRLRFKMAENCPTCKIW